MERRSDYTFKYNTKMGRHGWLRLTPAYSIKLVKEILHSNDLFGCKSFDGGLILDPFCGTATTGIVAAEMGLDCVLYDINPFLVWFGNIKSENFDPDELDSIFETVSQDLKELSQHSNTENLWIPQMKNIEISSGQDYLLKITLFPLVRFPSKGGYNIYSDLKAALQKFLAEHPVNPAKDMRLTIVYRRIVPWELTLGKARCDNDNFEMRRCTNAITDALAISDSVDKISFFYTTEQVPHRNCVEVFLLNETHIVTQKMLRIFSQ